MVQRPGPDPVDFSRCRAVGHAWDAIPVVDPAPYGLTYDLRCIHCYTIRRDILSKYDGRVIRRRYTYPDNYQGQNLEWDRTDWRSLWVTTLSDALLARGTELEPGEVAPAPAAKARKSGAA